MNLETNRLIITKFTPDMAQAVPTESGIWEVGKYQGRKTQIKKYVLRGFK